MSNGAHMVGTAARLGAGVISGVVRRVRLPRRPESPPDTGDIPRRSIPDRLRKLPCRKPVLLALLALTVVVVSLLVYIGPTWAGTTFTVTNTNDSGTGSLRQAIINANNTSNGTAGPDLIRFNIPGTGVKTITPSSYLPVITDPVVIDGYTQGDGTTDDATPNTLQVGNNAKLLVELNGTNLSYSGLYIGAANSTVRGLAINRFGGEGVHIYPGNNGNKVEGNFIGTSTLGTTALGNHSSGVFVEGSNNTVGGTTAGARNVISGNRMFGVKIQEGGATGNQVRNNHIGTAADGTTSLGNYASGVYIYNGSRNSVQDNIVAFNGYNSAWQAGVQILGSTQGNPILSNSIFSNKGLGIDLASNGAVAGYRDSNDAGDADAGPNSLQNYPTLGSVERSVNGTTTVQGTLNSTANTAFSVQFFSNPQADASGYGEGKTYLGQKDVTTDGNGNASFTFTTADAVVGEFVTATTTKKDTSTNPATYTDTSEFSAAVKVVRANTAPVAGDQADVTTSEDTVKLVTLSATDQEQDTLTYEITDLPDNGKLYKGNSTAQANEITGANTTLSDNQVTYVPNANYNTSSTPDTFKFRANDGTLNSNEATVSVAVGAVNDSPSFELPDGPDQTVNEDAAAQTVSGFATNISPGPSDESAQNVSFTVTNDNNPLFSAQPAIASNGTLTYTPAANASGTATVTVVARDDADTANGGDDTSEEQTFTITVSAVNDKPQAVNDSYGTDEDAELTIDAPGVLGNDGDTEDDALTAAVVDEPAHGDLMLDSDGSFTYTPDEDFEGEDSFTYKANDGADDSNTATVNITVKEVNDAPEGQNDAKTTPENTPLVFAASDLIANDSEGPENEEDQSLTVTEVKNPSKGTVSLSNGQISFTPQTDYNGSEASFEYTVCDNGQTNGQADPKCSTLTARVNITVSPSNSKPTATDGTKAMDEDSAPISIDFAALVSDTETSDANLTYNVTAPEASKGTLTGTGSTRSFSAAKDFSGTVDILYTVTDRGDPDNCGAPGEACAASKTSDEKKVTVTVNAVNDAPSISNIADKTINENTDTGDISFTIKDPDTPASNLTLTASSSNKTLVPDANVIFGGTGENRTVKVTPARGQTGTADIAVGVSDGATEASETFRLTVRDATAPTVSSTNPAAGATKVPLTLNQSGITATFSEKMQASSLNKDTVKLERITKKKKTTIATPVSLSQVALGADGKTLTIKPSSPFAKKGVYKATITTGARDEAGNALAQEKVWQFTMAKK